MHVSEQDARESISKELADILYRQETIHKSNSTLNLLQEEKVKDEFKSVMDEDEKNLHLLEAVISNFGTRLEPRPSVILMSQNLLDIVKDPASSPMEKLTAYVLLKQCQTICCQIVHKSVQVAKPEVRTALAQFDGIYVSVNRQKAELNDFMERVGVEWIMGLEPLGGLLGLARDALSNVAGTLLNKST